MPSSNTNPSPSRQFLLWDPWELKYVRDTCRQRSDQTIADALGRSVSAVQSKRQQLRLLKRGGHRRWSTEELAALRAAPADATDDQVAKSIGRTAWAVLTKRMGLGLPKKRKPFTGAEDALLRKYHARGWSDCRIGWTLDRRHNVIQRRRVKLGLGINYDGSVPLVVNGIRVQRGRPHNLRKHRRQLTVD